MGDHRRKYTDEYKAAAVERLYDTVQRRQRSWHHGQPVEALKTWRLEIEAFGSAEAKRRQKADVAELARLRKKKHTPDR